MAPVSEEEQDSAAHMDLRLGVKYSLRNLTANCFGVCDLTHRLNHPGIDWCWVCIDRLIWGYRVSCLVTIVTKDRTVGMGMSIEGSGVYASTQGLENPPVIPCDVIPVYVWMTEKFKDVLNKVMLVDKATVNSHSLQWGEDNGQVRGTRASGTIDRSVWRGGSDVCTVRFRALIGWTYYRSVADRLGRTSGSGI